MSDSDRELLMKACKVKQLDSDVQAFNFFRFNENDLVVYMQQSGSWNRHAVKDAVALASLLPTWFEIAANIALPDSVPVTYLAEPKESLQTSPRKRRQRLLNTIWERGDEWFTTTEHVASAASALVDAFTAVGEEVKEHSAQLKLAEDLLLKIAKIERGAFQDLLNAVNSGQDGLANGLVEEMNKSLAGSLNFPRWWSQDHHFQLLVTLRDQDLVFTIKDRTGTEYSATERSSGLKYFLSYFIQYLAHEPPVSGAREILLMDEPDAYLSSSGQQDLLKIFEDFAYPRDPSRQSCQVVYVTHSPFLIDKNHGERICVLEKGETDEGTRVVRNAARNHYEPLRSAFGSFVGETTFISNCNLMLEGMSDQIMLAGMSARLRRQGVPNSENLDLNTITLVPAGSASHIPYLVYLALGRDVDRPAVTVLLDSDKSGNEAVEDLRKGHKGVKLLDMSFVFQIGQLPVPRVASTRPGGAVAIEDLLPIELCVAAVKRYAADFLSPDEEAQVNRLMPGDVVFTGDEGTHEAVQRAAATLLPGMRIDKVGFARSILDEARDPKSVSPETLDVLDANFRALFQELGYRQRAAQRKIASEKTSSKLKRLKKAFVQDHDGGATKEEATLLFEEIDDALDNSYDAEDLRAQIRDVARKFALDDNPTESIKNFADFCAHLDGLVYREVNQSQT